MTNLVQNPSFEDAGTSMWKITYAGEIAFHFWSEDSDMELYAITNGEEQAVSFILTTYVDWKNPTIPEIKVTEGTLTICVRMKCNAKSWGTVDDFTLYRISN